MYAIIFNSQDEQWVTGPFKTQAEAEMYGSRYDIDHVVSEIHTPDSDVPDIWASEDYAQRFDAKCR